LLLAPGQRPGWLAFAPATDNLDGLRRLDIVAVHAGYTLNGILRQPALRNGRHSAVDITPLHYLVPFRHWLHTGGAIILALQLSSRVRGGAGVAVPAAKHRCRTTAYDFVANAGVRRHSAPRRAGRLTGRKTTLVSRCVNELLACNALRLILLCALASRAAGALPYRRRHARRHGAGARKNACVDAGRSAAACCCRPNATARCALKSERCAVAHRPRTPVLAPGEHVSVERRRRRRF